MPVDSLSCGCGAELIQVAQRTGPVYVRVHYVVAPRATPSLAQLLHLLHHRNLLLLLTLGSDESGNPAPPPRPIDNRQRAKQERAI